MPTGRLSSVQVRALVCAARQWGDGRIEITNRANLQLRGIHDGADSLGGDLIAAGLSAGPAGDRVRNVVTGPLAGLDPTEVIDTLPIVASVLDRLDADPTLHALPAKFGVTIDGGGTAHLADRRDNLVLTAIRVPGDGPWFVMRTGRSGSRRAESLRPGEVPAAIHAAMHQAIANAASDGVRRPPPSEPSDLSAPLMRALPPAPPIGNGKEHDPERQWVGCMPLLGRIDVAKLAAVADVAGAYGRGEIRLTPWRGIVIPHVRASDAGHVLGALRGLGMVVDPMDPAAGVVACAGNTGCTSGLTDAQGDALALITKLRREPRSAGPLRTIHVSGCEKRCAMRRPADVTYVGVSLGRYERLVEDRREEEQPVEEQPTNGKRAEDLRVEHAT